LPQIEVTFDIDANGILNVSAKDIATGKQQQITVTASSGLAKEEVERMVKEAEAHATEDAQRRQEIELRNQADSLVYTTERTLAEHGAKLSETERHAVEEALNEAREALKGDDVERIRRAQDNLTRASRALADAMYRQTTTNGPAGGPGASGAPPQGDVVDAEFKDADDRKS
jgi:molecular chaperone DnaK